MNHMLVGYDENGVRLELLLPPEIDVKALVDFDKDDPDGIFCYSLKLNFFIEPVPDEPAPTCGNQREHT